MFPLLLPHDYIEIIFYSSLLYLLCIWLKTDKTKNLVGYCLLYCIITLASWYTQMPTLTTFFFSSAPIALLLFIVLHEKTLQRNLVTLRTIQPAHKEPDNWLDIILSSALAIINRGKTITVIIEHQQSLEHCINAPFLINADISKGILDVLLYSESYDDSHMIWIDTTGTLRGINATWHFESSITEKKSEQMKSDVFFFTMQTDAIIFHINPVTRAFSFIVDGKETDNLSAHSIRILIKKHLTKQLSSHKKGAYRENNSSQKSPSA